MKKIKTREKAKGKDIKMLTNPLLWASG